MLALYTTIMIHSSATAVIVPFVLRQRNITVSKRLSYCTINGVVLSGVALLNLDHIVVAVYFKIV